MGKALMLLPANQQSAGVLLPGPAAATEATVNIPPPDSFSPDAATARGSAPTPSPPRELSVLSPQSVQAFPQSGLSSGAASPLNP